MMDFLLVSRGRMLQPVSSQPQGAYIVFACPEVERISVEKWSSDGVGVSYADAASVRNISNYFKENALVTSFDELQYFTSLTYIYGSAQNATRGAFYNCTNLRSVILPPSVTAIQQQAFMYCPALESINLRNVITIGVNAFRNSYLPIEIDLPNLTSLGLGAFSSTKITKIVSLGSITSIPGSGTNTNNCFYLCTQLKEVTLPSTITSIGQRAFRSCTALTQVVVKATNPPTLHSEAFQSTNNTFKIYVPQGCSAAYKSATTWSSYASRIFELDANGNIPT